jgi:hypothetical protein
MDMATKPFFEDAESSFFSTGGMPTKAGIYEFRRYDGRKILYTLDFMEQTEGEAPRLKVVHASRMADYPYPAHALNTLDGDWVRWLGMPGSDEAAPASDAGNAAPGAEGAAPGAEGTAPGTGTIGPEAPPENG